MRAVVAGWIGSTNLGDELVYAALVAKLRARGVEPVAISIDPAATAAGHGTAALAASSAVRQWRATGQSDVLFFGGGGLLQDETSPLNLPYHLLRTVPWRARRRPIGVVGVGVGALSTRLGRTLVDVGVSSAWPISVRDAASAELLVRLGFPPPVLAADLAFSTPPPAVERRDEVVVSLRPQVARGRLLPASRRWRSGLGDEPWLLRIAATLDSVATRTGLVPHFVAFQADRDGPLHDLVADRMTVSARRSTPTVGDVAATVGSARLVVGMRFHAGVLATVAGLPWVALDYSGKVGALVGELARGGAAVPVTADGLAALPDAAAGVFGHEQDVLAARHRLRARERGNDRVLDAVLEMAGSDAPRG